MNILGLISQLIGIKTLRLTSTKLQTENVFFGKTNSRALLRQNWAKFSSRTILPPNIPYSELGPEKRYGAGFIKKFQSKMCFVGWTNLHSGTLLPPIVPSSPFGQEIVEVRFSTKIQTENVFLGKKNKFEMAFEAKLSKVFIRNNFAPERTK